MPLESKEGDEKRSRPMSLRSSVLWATLGNGVYLVCQMATLMILAKIGSRKIVGEFSLALAVVSPVIIFSQMQLRQVLVTDAQHQFCFGNYLWCRLVLTAAALPAIAIIAAVGFTDSPWIILLVGLAKSFESISDVLQGRMQQSERIDLAAIGQITRGITTLALLLVLFWTTGSLLWAVAGFAGAHAATLLYDLGVQRRLGRGGEQFLVRNPASLRRLIWTAFPLALGGAVGTLATNLPRYFLDRYHGVESVAIYSVAMMPLTVIGVFMSGVSQGTLARAARYFQDGQMSAFNRLAIKVTAVQVAGSVLFTLTCFLFGAPLISLLFTPEYESAAQPLVLLAVALTIGTLSTHGTLVVSAARAFRLQLLNTVVSFVAMLLVCVVVVPKAGVIGVGGGEVFRFFVATVFLTIAGLIVYRRRASAGLCSSTLVRPKSQ